MAKLRSVSTAFWSDPFVEDLTPNQKLLFLYLITNEKTNMLGIYEASIKKMSFETDIEKGEISEAIKVFESKGKVKYIDNYVILIILRIFTFSKLKYFILKNLPTLIGRPH